MGEGVRRIEKERETVPHDNLWPVVLRIAEEPASSSRGAQDATLTLRLTMARRRRQLLHH